MKFYDFLVEKGKDDGIEKIVVGAVVVNNKNEMLLLSRKNNDFMGGIDELPSGNVEPGERLDEALIREVKEETNLNVIEITNYINSFDYISGSGKKARQYNFVVSIDDWKDVKLTEHDSYKWEKISDARNNNKITDEVKTCLEIYAFNSKKIIK